MREFPRAKSVPGFVFLLLLSAINGAAAADCIDYGGYLHWTRTVDIPALGVEIQGPFAYVAAESSGLQVLDITTPDAPTIVGSVDTPGRAWDLAVLDGYAYVVDGSNLQVIDISDHAFPSLVGNVDLPDYAWDIAISWPYVYLAAGLSGLLVIDVTNPVSPLLVHTVDTPYSANGVALFGDFAYVADGGAGIQVVDITNPSQAAITNTVGTLGLAEGATVSGSYLYVAELRGLEIMRIANPSSPQSIGNVATNGSSSVEVSGDYAYVVGAPSLQVIDVSHPAAPELLGSVDMPGTSQRVAIGDAYLYVASGSAGLRVIDNQNVTSPELVGGVDTAGGTAVAVDGSHAYVVGSTHFQAIDIQNVFEPSIVSTLESPNYYGTAIAVSGFYAYVTSFKVSSTPTPPPGPNDAMNVIDISDPENPVVVGSVALPDYASGIAVSGTFAYIADYSSLLILDIGNPALPQIVGSVETPGTAFRVSVAGTHAYVADEGSGLQVIDVSNPVSPEIVGSLDTPGSAVDVAVSGNHAFVADVYNVLSIDVSNPMSPQTVGEVRTPGTPRRISTSGQFAYALDGYYSGLRVIDITMPASPRFVGMADTPGDGFGIAVENDYVYLANGNAGLVIFPSQCNVITPVTLTHFQATAQSGAVLLEWDTSAESSLSGFHVLRSTHSEGDFERVNGALIQSPYRYLDTPVVAGTTYYYKLEAVDRFGNSELMGRVSATPGETIRTRLGPATPNPFGLVGPTEISFTLAQSGPVRLRILDISGREVFVLLDESLDAGQRSVSWNGTNNQGDLVPSGLYLYEIETQGHKEARRVVRIR